MNVKKNELKKKKKMHMFLEPAGCERPSFGCEHLVKASLLCDKRHTHAHTNIHTYYIIIPCLMTFFEDRVSHLLIT